MKEVSETILERDLKLIEDVKNGKRDFSIIYNNCYNFCTKSLIKKGASSEQANDIYQEAMIIFYKKISSSDFKLTSKMTTYLYRVCYNHWLKECERTKIFVDANTSSLDYSETEPNGGINYMVSLSKNLTHEDEYNEEDVKMILLKELIKKLSPNQEAIINLILEGKKNTEILSIMSYSSLDSLKARKTIALKKLKELIKEISLNKTEDAFENDIIPNNNFEDYNNFNPIDLNDISLSNVKEDIISEEDVENIIDNINDELIEEPKEEIAIDAKLKNSFFSFITNLLK